MQLKAVLVCLPQQVRDLETHQPMPGVTLGDIGPKMGCAPSLAEGPACGVFCCSSMTARKLAMRRS